MIATNYPQVLQLALPEVIVVVAALVALATDLLFLRESRTRVRFSSAATIGSLGCAGAIARLILAPGQGNVSNGMLLANPLTHLVQIALLVLAILTLLLSV
ncbi:MAG: NADH-quinone oxidoreductase subunit N, partial [Acidobacteriaceae bacterium]